MKKFLLAAIIISVLSAPLTAHNAHKHNQEMERVLFGLPASYDEKIDHEKVLKLEAAVYLAVDYFAGVNNEAAGTRALETLGMERTIKLKDIATPGNHHEVYTHLGWDDSWYHGGRNARKKWSFRRDKILTATVLRLTGGDNTKKKQKTALAKLCYYIHITGDHEGNKPGSSHDRMCLVPRPNVKAQNCIIDELVICLGELFPDQDCSSLLADLKEIKRNARQIDDATDEGSERIKTIATRVLELLYNNVPDMLKQEDFFAENFFPDEVEIDWGSYFSERKL